MKVLRLTLEKKWFDMIESGEKREEYREIKPYWIKRLVEINNPEGRDSNTPANIIFDLNNGHYWADVIRSYHARLREFDHIFCRNGYNPLLNPSWRRKCEGITIGEGNPEWGAEPGEKYFVIKLGEKL